MIRDLGLDPQWDAELADQEPGGCQSCSSEDSAVAEEEADVCQQN
jgi:hypothetical protein